MNNLSHIAIIMDGNRRWAKERHLEVILGHKEGYQAAKRISLAAKKKAIPFLSLYVFSTENWKRSKEEIALLEAFIRFCFQSEEELQFLDDNDIRLVFSGSEENVDPEILSIMDKVIQRTKNHKAITVNLAYNYGGQDEIIRAFKKYSQKYAAQDLTQDKFISFLDHGEMGPVDLLIRAGGEKRISNFLLWQLAYAEMYFDDIYWPQWGKTELEKALTWFEKRQRRFGGGQVRG